MTRWHLSTIIPLSPLSMPTTMKSESTVLFRGPSFKNGGFWYTNCGAFQPNAEYHDGVGGQYQKYIFWKNFRGKYESLKETLMMFRKKQ